MTAGLGLFSLVASGEFHGNLPLLPSLLVAPEALDFKISSAVPSFITHNWTSPLPEEWKPNAEFTFPIGTRPLAPPAYWQPGALQ
jgi:hypothetical protein